MDINEHYKILELNLGATNEEIKAAYKRLAIKYHPDKNNDPGAEDQFKKISESYQYLTNNNNTVRQMNNMNNINNINANELFNQFFKMVFNFKRILRRSLKVYVFLWFQKYV